MHFGLIIIFSTLLNCGDRFFLIKIFTSELLRSIASLYNTETNTLVDLVSKGNNDLVQTKKHICFGSCTVCLALYNHAQNLLHSYNIGDSTYI